MASCVRNILTKNYQTLVPVIGFQVTVENVEDAFLGHSVERIEFAAKPSARRSTVCKIRCNELNVQLAGSQLRLLHRTKQNNQEQRSTKEQP